MDRKLRDEMRRLCATYRWKAEFEASPACTPTPEVRLPRGTVGTVCASDMQWCSAQVSCKQSRAAFKRRRDALVQAAFARMNRVVFRGRMPEDLPIQWSKTLTTTAGITRFVGNSCSVELSEKAIDSEERLETTLIHELCHVAVFVLDQATKQPPHGAAFRKWADLAESELGCEVTTCHSFDIFTPHKFRCTNDECGQTYGRHSKKGIDTEKKVCGRCTGRLEYQGRFDADGKVIAIAPKSSVD